MPDVTRIFAQSVVGPLSLAVGTATMALAGWWCHLQRYPSFRGWSEDEFCRRHAGHTFQISLAVIPGMILQVIGAASLQVQSPNVVLRTANAVCVVGSLLPTIFVSAPLHRKLSKGKDDELVDRLIATNLPRTLFWTAHFALALAWAVQSGQRA